MDMLFMSVTINTCAQIDLPLQRTQSCFGSTSSVFCWSWCLVFITISLYDVPFCLSVPSTVFVPRLLCGKRRFIQSMWCYVQYLVTKPQQKVPARDALLLAQA